MNNWRHLNFPANPNDIHEFADQLREGEYDKALNKGNLKMSAVVVEENENAEEDEYSEEHILLYDEEFVKEHFVHTTHLFIDATFQCCPRIGGAHQLLTVLAVFANMVNITFFLASFKFQFLK